MAEEEDLDDDFDPVQSAEPDPLDAESFNPVDYINRHFPNEASLAGLDPFVENLRAQQRRLDDDIRLAVRRQAASGRRARADLDEAKAAVRELFERIKAIKAKAQQSEELVSDVCRDIKSLDIAKRNLTLTVTALKRLVMLVAASEQLRAHANQRQYFEASQLIRAVEELAGHFKELSHVPRVADLLERKAIILSDLKHTLLDDYASLLRRGQEVPEDWGVAAAQCVDAIGPAMRREVVTQFCLRILEDYKDIFQPPKEASDLEMAERRFAWLKRTLREFEEKYKGHFPESWRVPCGLCMHFCHVTRQHLVEILSMSHHTVDPELMVRVLRKAIDFENDLARKYPPEDVSPPLPPASDGYPQAGLKYPEALDRKTGKASASSSAGRDRASAAVDDDAEFAPRFKGIISECFDAYLGSWVQHEERSLIEVLDKANAAGDKIVGQDDERDEEEDEDAGLEPRCVYGSAPSLFAAMKGSMTKCTAFSTHTTLFDVFQVFRKVLVQYADRLDKRLPAKVTTPLDAAAVQAVCAVIGTAEYCDETLPQFVDLLLKVVSPEFESRVTFDLEQERMRTLMNKANQVLVQSVSCSLDEAFLKMTRTNWAGFTQDVGDLSPYVGDVSAKLSKQFTPVAANLSKIHYRFFCDKFVQSFVARFIGEIFKCKKISEQGAQQLLLDTKEIKTTLLEAPVIAGKGRPMQTAYSNYVLREMGRAETMLKVLSSPDVVDEAAAAALLGEGRGSSPEEIRSLLALRSDAAEGSGPMASPREEEGGGTFSWPVGNYLGDALNQNRAKAAEDFKKLAGDAKKNFQRLSSLGVGLQNITGRK